MGNKNLVGRCGLYCGSCLVYRAYKDSAELRRKIAQEEKCQPEDVRCEGCQTVLTDGWNSKEWGKNCRIVACLESKELQFCYECAAFPDCDKFHGIADYLLQRGENLIENLRQIQAGKSGEWLEKEEQKWRCKACRKPISAYLDTCHWCGAKEYET